MRSIQSIKEKYPKMFTDSCFDFSIGDGWLGLVDSLCSMIQFHIDHHGEYDTETNERKPLPQVFVHQIKEKFGGLRFYVGAADDHVWGLIEFAENVSYRICELCGTTKNVGKTTGWIKVLCKDCYEKARVDRHENSWEQYGEDISWAL